MLRGLRLMMRGAISCDEIVLDELESLQVPSLINSGDYNDSKQTVSHYSAVFQLGSLVCLVSILN